LLHKLRNIRSTVRVKAWQADRLSSESIARVAAIQNFVTSLVHQVDAVCLPANRSKGWLGIWRSLLYDFVTISAAFSRLEGSKLFASLTKMIRSSRASSAEVSFALWASDSVLSHMHTCFLGHFVSLFIFGVQVDSSFSNFKDISTSTLNKRIILSYELLHLKFFKLVDFFWPHVHFKLIIRHSCFAVRTFNSSYISKKVRKNFFLLPSDLK
jgi:hypothetical protein